MLFKASFSQNKNNNNSNNNNNVLIFLNREYLTVRSVARTFLPPTLTRLLACRTRLTSGPTTHRPPPETRSTRSPQNSIPLTPTSSGRAAAKATKHLKVIFRFIQHKMRQLMTLIKLSDFLNLKKSKQIEIFCFKITI